jgi:insulysin
MNPQFGEADFSRAHRKVSDELLDVTRSMPYELALDAMSALTVDDVSSREEVSSAMGKIDEAALRGHLDFIAKRGLRAQLLVVGNVGEASARQLAAKVSRALGGGSRGLLGAEAAQRTHVLVAPEGVEVRMRNPIPGDKNHAIVNSYQYGVPNIADRVKLLLLGKMISNPVYDELRTKRQLGYVVFGLVAEQVSVLELRVLVQGEKETPDAVDTDIETVLGGFGDRLKNMPKAEFLRWKASLASGLHHKDQNMGQETDRYWSQIANDGHCFNRKELELQYLETMESPDEVLKVFQAMWQSSRKVSLKLFGAGANLDAPPHPPKNASALLTAQTTPVLRLNGVGFAMKQRLEQAGAATYTAGGVCYLGAASNATSATLRR